MHCSADYI